MPIERPRAGDWRAPSSEVDGCTTIHKPGVNRTENSVNTVEVGRDPGCSSSTAWEGQRRAARSNKAAANGANWAPLRHTSRQARATPRGRTGGSKGRSHGSCIDRQGWCECCRARAGLRLQVWRERPLTLQAWLFRDRATTCKKPLGWPMNSPSKRRRACQTQILGIELNKALPQRGS